MHRTSLVASTALLSLSLSAINVNAQDKAPLVKGTVNISVKQGTFDCDFIVSDLPMVADHFIRINTGMNMRYLRNMEDTYNFVYGTEYNEDEHSESFGYYIPDNTGKGKVRRPAYRISYTGKYPVMKDTLKAYAAIDWKGNIAFNGYSVRADGCQSCWYPVFYDVKADKVYDDVRYDLEINCSDCSTIYLNGNAPVQGTKAHFKSDDAKELMLFAGNYKMVNDNGTYFLNPDISPAQIKEFGAMTKKFKSFYEQKLGIPYKYSITYINTTPVSKRNAWMFVSYPTIVNIGWGKHGLKGMFDGAKGDWFKTYMAHELGHYYFGNYKTFNSPLGDMMGEGFGEYLALQVTKNVLSDTLYNAKVEQMIKDVKDFKPVPFSKIQKDKDYDDRELYVYRVAPLIFTAIEKEVGIEIMWKWLHNVLETKADFTDYKFLEQTLEASISDRAKAKLIEDKYFSSDAALANAIAMIGS